MCRRQRRAEAPLAFPHKSFANQIDLFCGQIVAIRQGRERAEGSSLSKYYSSGGGQGGLPLPLWISISTNAQSRFVIVVLDNILAPPHVAHDP